VPLSERFDYVTKLRLRTFVEHYFQVESIGDRLTNDDRLAEESLLLIQPWVGVARIENKSIRRNETAAAAPAGIGTPEKIHRRVTYKGNENSISRRKPRPSPMRCRDNYSAARCAFGSCDRGGGRRPYSIPRRSRRSCGSSV